MPPNLTDRYSRQLLLNEIGEQGQQRLAESSALIVGCGALGSTIAQSLVRAGVGRVRLVDRDVVELSNLHRQILYDEWDAAAKVPKAKAALARLSRINSSTQLEAEVASYSPHNAESLSADVSIVLDGTDNLEARYIINDACVKQGKPWVYGGAVGTGGVMLPIVPEQGPCLRCLFEEPPPAGSVPTCDTVGVLGTAPILIGALQATAALKLLVGDRSQVGWLTQLDLWTGHHSRVRTKRREACPTCQQRQFEFLTAGGVAWVTTLCGRNAVQISPAKPAAVDLKQVQRGLQKVTEAHYNGLLLTATIEGHEVIIFPDGRAIIKGTTDEIAAKALYDRYIGV